MVHTNMNWIETVYKRIGLAIEPFIFLFLKFLMIRQNLTVDLYNFWQSGPVFNDSGPVPV